MLATSMPGAERIYENDVVYRFAANSDGLAISVGKVQSDPSDTATIPHIGWYIGEKTREPVSEAAQQGKIYVFNREIYIGSVALLREVRKGGFVIGTKHKMVGSVEKVGQDGTKRKYIVSDISVERLEKIFPFKIGNFVYSRGWIGKVVNMHMQVHWTFDRPTNTATATLPIGLVEKLQLKEGETVSMLSEQIRKKCVFKTQSWNPLALSRLQNKPATLTKMDLIELEVCWIERLNQSVSTGKPDSAVRADSSVKVFHLCKDDWEYFGPTESFQMNWEFDDHAKTLTYEQWQSQMLISGVEAEENSPSKRIKGNSIFNIGDRVVVTPVGLQTIAVVTFPNGPNVINHTMKACDIPELGSEVIPRQLPLNFPSKMEFKNMDLVYDKIGSSKTGRYGFVLDPSGEDGKVLVNWIYELDENDTLEKPDWVQKRDLVLLPFQSEFNPKVQGKIVVARDGNLGTFRGIMSLNCRAVVRLVGTFDDKEYWPHELKFLKK